MKVKLFPNIQSPKTRKLLRKAFPNRQIQSPKNLSRIEIHKFWSLQKMELKMFKPIFLKMALRRIRQRSTM